MERASTGLEALYLSFSTSPEAGRHDESTRSRPPRNATLHGDTEAEEGLAPGGGPQLASIAETDIYSPLATVVRPARSWRVWRVFLQPPPAVRQQIGNKSDENGPLGRSPKEP